MKKGTRGRKFFFSISGEKLEHIRGAITSGTGCMGKGYVFRVKYIRGAGGSREDKKEHKARTKAREKRSKRFPFWARKFEI